MNTKVIITSVGAWLWAMAAPALPAGVLCTAMVTADVVSARRLARRLCKKHPEKKSALKFSSARFGRVICSLSRIYSVLVLAAMVDAVVAIPGVSTLRLATGAVCFWQAVSILENESSACGARWARILSRILVDKTERHLGIDLSELRSEHHRNPGADIDGHA